MNINFSLFSLFCVAIISGCVSSPIVKDAKDEEMISSLFATCNDPYELSEDCSIFSGATRSIYIDNFEIKIAGSADGKTVLIMDTEIAYNACIAGLTFSLITNSQRANRSYELIKQELNKKGLPISKVQPFGSYGNVDGYFIHSNEDIYSYLKIFSKEKE